MRLERIAGGILIDVPAITALLPTAFHTIVAALLVKEEKLELEGISVVGNCAEKDGAGGILKLESGVAEELKQPWIGIQCGERAVGIVACRPIDLLPKLRGKAGVGECGDGSRSLHPLREFSLETLQSTTGNVRAPLASVNIRGQEPLAVEVRFQVAAGKRQIAPASAIVMAPPGDVGEGLVVKGKAAEEDFGALNIINVLVINTLVKRRILAGVLYFGEESVGGALDACGESFGGGVREPGGIHLLGLISDWSEFASELTQLKMLIGGCHPRFEVTVLKKRLKLVAQSFEITGSFAVLTIEDLRKECFKVVNVLLIFMTRNYSLQFSEHLFEFTSDVTIEPRIFFHLLPNPLHQRPKSLWHLTGANALPQLPNDFPNFTMTRSLDPTKPLEERDNKVQHGVADLILCDIRGKNAAAVSFRSFTVTKHSTLIPNELLKSLNQVGNKITRTTSTQSILNLIQL
ncbi:uncharacterized protein BcabD6B2_28380 [Babesia caballi]|uniref:Uncharacterized protein n=1 Tax=Babesia caballi TaxID=5871 RepID=A0AAV4LTB8_BABCB|nr:hypothetical protein BcabD6B2_28380 [Babesia caballi]